MAPAQANVSAIPDAARGPRSETPRDEPGAAPVPDDLAREVYCVLGMPVDTVDMAETLRRIEAAARGAAPFLISTPNLNFLVNSRNDAEFRETLIDSDLCPADGMPIVWIARLTGIPVRQRIAGSDIFETLKTRRNGGDAMPVYLFGGPDGAAAAAAQALNAGAGGLRCVGSMSPGFGSVDEMSADAIIERINASDARFLAVALGAMKGQAWLRRNHHRLAVPVRAHLGATINFETGAVRRAPRAVRKLGLEWLWRIKEEPQLWKRYRHDGGVLARLMLTRVLPLATGARWRRRRCERKWPDLLIRRSQDDRAVTLSLSGAATARHAGKAASWFREALTAGTPALIINLTDTRVVDARFFGLLLMLRKELKRRGAVLKFTGVSPTLARLFRLNEVEFLLLHDQKA